MGTLHGWTMLLLEDTDYEIKTPVSGMGSRSPQNNTVYCHCPQPST